MLGLARPYFFHLLSEELLLERVNLLLHIQALEVPLNHIALFLVVPLLDQAVSFSQRGPLLHINAFHLIDARVALSLVGGPASWPLDIPNEIRVVLLIFFAG